MASVEMDDARKEVSQNMTISRGDKVEKSIELKACENLSVLDESGKQQRFGDLYKNQKTIIIFIRHFLCYMTKEYVDDLALIPEKYLKAAGVKVIVIGCGPVKFIEAFRDITGYKYDLYTDPDRELYKKMGCSEKFNFDVSKVKDSKHVKSGYVMGVLRMTWVSMQYKAEMGDMDQQGGAFIIGPGDTIHHSHWDMTPVDHESINDLLAVAGVDMVNFAKDKRVFTV